MEEVVLRNSSVLLLAMLLWTGCAGPKESGQEKSERPGKSRMSEAPGGYMDMSLAGSSDVVRTVQLYLGNDEQQLPILPMRSGEPLTLEFDLMGDRGRPLSAYFYHADRQWKRDLSPAEYLSSFQRDDLLDYSPSQATELRYMHYTYRFPNDNIRFLVSGNYILRITEQGREDEVLFERAFFLTEQAVPLEMGAESVLISGGAFPSTLPIVRFEPPEAFAGNVFDYQVCFVRNGRFESARCTDRPSLASPPGLQFYLEPEFAFESQAADYFLDLGNLHVGDRIEGTDLSTSPYRITLEPDYARFPGSILAPSLNGQSVVSGAVRDTAQPDLGAEYVLVGFSFVPPEESPLEGELIVTGSFSDWRYDPANKLEWVAERSRYEGNILLKQGQYEYRYFSPDRNLRRILNTAPPSDRHSYTALVYFDDIRLNTDRLLSVGRTIQTN